MRSVTIRWTELETAFERNAPNIESFLETRTGEVLSISEAAPDAQEMRRRVSTGGDAFIRVEPASSREQYKWMERFVTTVLDPALRERLVISIDGKGAFRRFKDVLLNYPVERERWFTYRAGLLHWNMQEWLRREELVPLEAAPWGIVDKPEEDEVSVEHPAVPPSVGAAPGEVLRRQARDLIDQIPALELPAAIAFLDFLRERGVAELTRSKLSPPGQTAGAVIDREARSAAVVDREARSAAVTDSAQRSGAPSIDKSVHRDKSDKNIV